MALDNSFSHLEAIPFRSLYSYNFNPFPTLLPAFQKMLTLGIGTVLAPCYPLGELLHFGLFHISLSQSWEQLRDLGIRFLLLWRTWAVHHTWQVSLVVTHDWLYHMLWLDQQMQRASQDWESSVIVLLISVGWGVSVAASNWLLPVRDDILLHMVLAAVQRHKRGK